MILLVVPSRADATQLWSSGRVERNELHIRGRHCSVVLVHVPDNSDSWLEVDGRQVGTRTQ